MIQITSKSRYAVCALAELVSAGGVFDGAPVPIGEIARRRDIPVQFLEQLFSSLRKARILKSQRGVKGGYSLARDPRSVSVLEVVEVLDGQVGAGIGDAVAVFKDASGALRKVLAETTIAQVVEQEAKSAGTKMYQI